MKLQRIVEKKKEVNRIQKTVTVFCHKIHNVESAGRLALDEQITRGSLVDTNVFITPRSSSPDSIDSFVNASPFLRVSSQSFSLERLSFIGRRELNRIRTFDSKI